jgi:hypothetical protein
MGIGVGLVRLTSAKPLPKHPRPAFETYVREVDLPVDDERYPYLRLIDPYDDLQPIPVRHRRGRKFERLATERSGQDTRAVRDLVRACAGDDATQLWFVGD